MIFWQPIRQLNVFGEATAPKHAAYLMYTGIHAPHQRHLLSAGPRFLDRSNIIPPWKKQGPNFISATHKTGRVRPSTTGIMTPHTQQIRPFGPFFITPEVKCAKICDCTDERTWECRMKRLAKKSANICTKTRAIKRRISFAMKM